MELQQVIENRRSIRRFTAESVAPAQVEALLEAARLCQSADNRQPWRFLVLTGEDLGVVADVLMSIYDEREIAPGDDAYTCQYAARVIRGAPLLICTFYERTTGRLDSDYLSIGAAMEHICLRATDLGLGAVWIGDVYHVREKLAERFGYPDLTLVGCIAVGHPDEAPAPRPRKSMAEIRLDR